MEDIKIGNRLVGPSHPPMVIAEMSGNHNQSLDRALEIIQAAADAGCHGLKIQTYTADTMTIDSGREEFTVKEQKSLWQGKSLHKLYQQAYTPWEWHAPIFKKCRELGLIAFSTPFDETAVDFLESLDVPAYKIASFENADIPLIEKAAATGKPLIISTGMATVAELDETVKAAKKAGCRNLILLKCTSSYPSTPEDTNLMTIPHMRDLFNVHIGLSDHTRGIGVGIASVALGAVLLEKHFTLSREDGGVDSAFSMEPFEMKLLVEESVKAHQAMGKVFYGTAECEKDSLRFRRSVYAIEDIKKGEKFTDKNTRRIRPGYGLPPKYHSIVLGKTATANIERGTPLKWDLIG